ncbi:protein SIEVE ELEMENT OCCLUSION B-like [Argentina anserina]|uniref:protein SIEVE ELEMENT OCCLUSION B-like n=1 Tax=Argentina anserina TaxID=57926 RepID=UPI0021767675|nr:protein SIEVE ELEMENT OCCLUSION B-like [Potentilla anserina]
MALVPQNKTPNNIPKGDYCRPHLLSRDSHRQFETEDSSIISQVLYIDESHDDRPYDPTPISLKHILRASEVILSHADTPDIHSDVSRSTIPASGADEYTLEDDLEQFASSVSLHESYGVPTSIFIAISGKLFTKKWITREDNNKQKIAMGILHAVHQYDWQEKVVLVLGTFAVKNGELWLVAQLYTTYALAREIGKLEQLPELLEGPATNSKSKFEAYNNLVQAVLKVTKLIIRLQEIRRDPDSNAELESTTNSTDFHIATAVYWTIWSLVVAASHFVGITCMGLDYKMEAWGLSFAIQKLETIQGDLEESINSLYDAIKRKKDDKDLAAIAYILENPHLDNIKPLKVLFFKDQPALYDCYRKRRVSIGLLKGKIVILFLTDLDILHEKEYMIVQQMYMEKHHEPTKPENQYEVVWIPILDTWTAAKYERFETIRNAMEWYSVYLPSVVSPTVIRYIRKEDKWNFVKKPLLVVMDPQGNIVHNNAVHMICVFGSIAFPFNKSREDLLWEKETWRMELVADPIDDNILSWITERKHLCLYGGEDINWIRNFTRVAKNVAWEAGIGLELLYVGKNKAKERLVKNIMRIIQDENLSHTIEWHLISFFWTRLESMWQSKGHQLQNKLKSSQLRSTDSVAMKKDDAVMQGIISMLSFGSSDHGWAVIGACSAEMSKANGEHMLRSLREFNAWKTRHIEIGFTPALNEYLAGVSKQAPHHCSNLTLPVTGLMPETVACAECGRIMERFNMFLCCSD